IVSILFSFTPIGDWLFGSTSIDGIVEAGIFESWLRYPILVLVTTVCWIVVTYITPKESNQVLFDFYRKIQPGGPGWKKVLDDAEKENVKVVTSNEPWSVPYGVAATIVGTIVI